MRLMSHITSATITRTQKTSTYTQTYCATGLKNLEYRSRFWDPPHKTHIIRLERVKTFAVCIATGNWSGNSVFL